MHPVESIANHWKWPKHNDEIWYNKVEQSDTFKMTRILTYSQFSH